MTSALAVSLRNGNHNGTLPNVVKRDKREVPYSRTKIESAVQRCLVRSCQLDLKEAREKAEQVARQVETIVKALEGPVTVEQIQDEVVRQLMIVVGYHAGHEYLVYREAHRKQRAEHPVDPELAARVQESARHFTGVNRHLQLAQYYDKFARFDWGKMRRETWVESWDRVLQYFQTELNASHPGVVLPEEWCELREAAIRQEATSSLRCLQLAGPALHRCQSGCYNCSFQSMDSPKALADELYLLMQGCGVGFSVESKVVEEWPRVRSQRKAEAEKYQIPDTAEGWCDAVKHGVERWLGGHDVDFDFSAIRPEGAVLKTKGGRSSGPGPLRELLQFARSTILARQGKVLTSLDLHDITCYAHRIVQMGGVRRASGISLSDLDDRDMRHAKDGRVWETHPHRNQANNSAIYEERPSVEIFMEEWLSLVRSKSGERGIFNRGSLAKQFPKRRKFRANRIYGTNPCSEIWLQNRSFCNLSIAISRPTDTVAELERKVRLAAIWGTLQSTMTRFNYIAPEWKQHAEEERLLGVDILGHLDCPLLRPGAEKRAELLDYLRTTAVSTNALWAERLGINQSAAVTCGKPSGDSSVLFDVPAGFKPHHAQYWIRRLRFSPTNPVAHFLIDAGVPWARDKDASGLLVLDFPCRAPDGGLILADQPALEQLANWKEWKLHYTEHNPSITVYVKPDEWLDVGHWVWNNWDIVGGLSFLPYCGGVYKLAPYEAIGEEEYVQRRQAFPDLDFSKLSRYEDTDYTTAAQQVACQGGACQVF